MAGIPQVRFSGVTFNSLAGRGVIVTGGASGIGAEIVRAFAGQRCKVGFVDRDETAGRSLASQLADVFFIACDVTDVPVLQESIGRLAGLIGGVDVLVNNVANDLRHKLEDITPEFFDDCIAVNLRPHFFAAQAVLPSMRDRGGGSIVNLGSGSWKNKTPNLPIYATAKSAMLGFTRSLARDLGRDNIRVNCVVPGWTMTERQVSLWVDAAGERAMDENHCIPGRIVGADIAHMVLFLAADTARMVTAQEFVVDAGWA
jgi:NAD(P)-dependent dehydrogenase (short-subunit alcohol dehydrogenase family)